MSTEKLWELATKWRRDADPYAEDDFGRGEAQAFLRAAKELSDALLRAANTEISPEVLIGLQAKAIRLWEQRWADAEAEWGKR